MFHVNGDGHFRLLSNEQIAAVLDEGRTYGLPKDRAMWAAVFGLLCEFGPRVSELFWLRREDVDLVKGTVAITTLKRWRTLKDGSRVRVPHKRLLPLRPWLTDLLRAHLDTAPPGDMVFPVTSPHTGRCRIWQAWKACCRRVGVENRRLHDVRHTVATRLAEVDPILARDVLGHASLSTTNTYVHCRNLAARFLSAPGAMGAA